MADLEAMDEAE